MKSWKQNLDCSEFKGDWEDDKRKQVEAPNCFKALFYKWEQRSGMAIFRGSEVKRLLFICLFVVLVSSHGRAESMFTC